MKKILLSGFLLTSFIFGEQLRLIPIDKSLLAQENGGNKTAIDAYSDGIGIITGSEKIDNTPMNELVFKYGEKAKEEGNSLKGYTLNNGISKEKDLAEKLGKVGELNNNLDGTSCNDGNAQTINDKFLNEICIGTNVEGQSCDDGNIQTINDMYINGICTGTNVEGQSCDDGNAGTINDVYKNGICEGIIPPSASFKLLFEKGTSIQGGDINFSTNQIYGYRVAGNGVKGYHSIPMQEVYNMGIKILKFNVTSGSCGSVYMGRIGNIDYGKISNTAYGTSNTQFTFNLDTKIVTIVGPLDGRWSRTIDLSAYPLDQLVIGISAMEAGSCWTSWSF